MYSITDSSLFFDGLPVILGHICAPVMLRYISGVQMCLSISRLFVSKKSKHTLITPHGIGYFDPFFVTVKQNCACWYLALVSTFLLHQTSSLHLELFHNIYKQDNLVLQVCVLCYIQVEMAFLATVLYTTTGWFMLLILKVFEWFSSQVLHKNTVISLFSSSFQVTRFKNIVLNTALLTLNCWNCFN